MSEELLAKKRVEEFLAAFTKFSDGREVCYGIDMGDLRGLVALASRAAPQITEPVGGDGPYFEAMKQAAERIAELEAALSAQPQQAVDVEAVARAMYDDWPFRVISQALADQSGQEIGSTITYDKVLEMGGNHRGLLRFAEAALAALSRPVADVERVREAGIAFLAKIDKLADGQCGPFAIRNCIANSAEYNALREALSSLQEVPGAEAGG